MKAHPDFTTEEAFRVIDDIISYARPVIVLSGGEPLMRSDVFRIAKYGTEKGLRMCLATNGTLVDEEICREIKDSGIRIVSLSLDGSEEKVHDDSRGQSGPFACSIRAAGLFRKNGIEFIVNSSIHEEKSGRNPEGKRACEKPRSNSLVYVHDRAQKGRKWLSRCMDLFP